MKIPQNVDATSLASMNVFESFQRIFDIPVARPIANDPKALGDRPYLKAHFAFDAKLLQRSFNPALFMRDDIEK